MMSRSLSLALFSFSLLSLNSQAQTEIGDSFQGDIRLLGTQGVEVGNFQGNSFVRAVFTGNIELKNFRGEIKDHGISALHMPKNTALSACADMLYDHVVRQKDLSKLQEIITKSNIVHYNYMYDPRVVSAFGQPTAQSYYAFVIKNFRGRIAEIETEWLGPKTKTLVADSAQICAIKYVQFCQGSDGLFSEENCRHGSQTEPMPPSNPNPAPQPTVAPPPTPRPTPTGSPSVKPTPKPGR